MSSSDDIELDPKAPPVDRAAGSATIDAAAAIGESRTVATVTEIAAAIASGQLDPIAAQQLLIDRVLAEQFPDVTDIEPLRARLIALLAEDPTLAGLLRA